MKIYVAASRESIDIARDAMTRLRAEGHTITHDWIADIDRNGAEDVAVDRAELLRCATADLHGVATADVFWLMSSDRNGCGCFVELGFALANPAARIVISGCLTRTLFYVLAEETDSARLFEDHEAAMIHILNGAP